MPQLPRAALASHCHATACACCACVRPKNAHSMPAVGGERERRQSEAFIDQSVTEGPPPPPHQQEPAPHVTFQNNSQKTSSQTKVRVSSGERSRRPSEYQRQGYVTLGQPPYSKQQHATPQVHAQMLCSCCGCSCTLPPAAAGGSEPLWVTYMQRVPWLVGLMMVQSVSSVVLQRYEGLIEANVIIASYLTMLVGGGGNAAVQVVTDIVRRTAIASGDTAANPQLLRTLGRELALAIFVAPTLAGVSYLRVRYLGVRASAIDSLAIALSYLAIIGVAVVTGVAVTFLLQRFGTSKLAATGAAPTTQVLVDVLGIVVVVLICEGLLGQEAPDDFCEQCGEVGGVSCIDVARCNVTDIATVGMATP